MNFLAFDLGATSGRSVLGTLNGQGKLEMKELTRFPNAMMPLDGGLHWNIYALFEELKRGLKECARCGVVPDSVGIDTWGVDYGCVAPDGSIISLPFAYRDGRTAGAADRFFREAMPASELYRRTGIQHMDFNTAFQLYEHRRDFAQSHAAMLLFIPDLLSYMLTGEAVTEYTIASTGAIVDAAKRTLDLTILRDCGAEPRQFARLVQPGQRIGLLKEEIAREVGLPQVPIVAVAGHDTASAVAAIPATDPDFAYLSSGTWSLMGIETSAPVINSTTESHNITNEGGVCGTIRLLKNITGMWILEQCLKKWKEEGKTYTYPQLVEMAQASKEVCTIDPDDPSFTAPEDMPRAIAEYCRATGQPVPEDHGQYVRSIFGSLAKKYAKVLGVFISLSDHPVKRLHVIGGGSRNAFLNQLTADAIGLPVVAGPAEATALGNIMLQAMAAGLVPDLGAMRRLIAENVPTTTFNPAV